MTKSASIHAWLVENGPATTGAIAAALGMDKMPAKSLLYQMPLYFIKVATIRNGRQRDHLWHARPLRTVRRRYQTITLADGRTVAAYHSAVNHCWLLADGVTVVWPVEEPPEDGGG